MRSELIHKIFRLRSAPPADLLLEVYRYQYAQNPVYRSWCDAIGRSPREVNDARMIPFLPISFFKTHEVKTGSFTPETWFESSGTTGAVSSRHYIRSLGLYRQSFLAGFRHFYGEPGNWCILGLLPAYLERSHSSLVVMVNELIHLSGHSQSGFYLYDQERLAATLQSLETAGQQTMLFGVTFALVDFAERYPQPLNHTIIMETGGMKGRGRELTRAELHQLFGAAFGRPAAIPGGNAPQPMPEIHAEYGMTELLSQAYAPKNGIFYTPPWLKVSIREDDDPLIIKYVSGIIEQGIINITDLANLDSCCFIATDDLGRLHPDGGFEVLGRVDQAEVRGCSQLVL